MKRSSLAVSSLILLALACGVAACAGAAEEVTEGASDALALDSAYRGQYGFLGGASGDLQELSLDAPTDGSVPPYGALAFGRYSAQVATTVLDPSASCPVELAPCTYNEAGTWYVQGTPSGHQTVTLSPDGGTPRIYFTNFVGVARRVIGPGSVVEYRPGSLGATPIRLRKKNPTTNLLADNAWGNCDPGFHPAVVAPGQHNTGNYPSGLAPSRTRCVPDIPHCSTVLPIEPSVELMITHPSVVRNPSRAANATGAAGAFTIGRMIKNMIPAGNAVTPGAAFRGIYESMLAGSVGGIPFSNQARPSASITAFLASLPKTPDGEVDVDRLHRSAATQPGQGTFELLAIVYRPDIQGLSPQGTPKVGEGRLVFAASDSHEIIFEYRLPQLTEGSQVLSVEASRRVWALRFHALRSLPPFSDAYVAQLEQIVSGFAGAQVNQVGVQTPNGNALAQIRTNEIEFGGPWQLREFNLVGAAGGGSIKIVPVTTKENLARSIRLGLAAESGAALRAQFLGLVAANQGSVLSGNFSIPSPFLGGVADTFDGGAYQATFAGSGLPQNVQNALISRSCNGCHNNTTGQTPSFGFTHVRATSTTIQNPANPLAGQDRLSPFIQTDMATRAAFLRSLLCQGQPHTVDPQSPGMPGYGSGGGDDSTGRRGRSH